MQYEYAISSRGHELSQFTCSTVPSTSGHAALYDKDHQRRSLEACRAIATAIQWSNRAAHLSQGSKARPPISVLQVRSNIRAGSI
jgi:hypothetical protein